MVMLKKMLRYALWVVPVLLLIIGFCYAADAVAVAATPAADPVAAPWYASLLQYVVEGVAALAGLALTALFNMMKNRIAKTDDQKQALDTLHASFALIEADLEKEIKADLADGTIDATEMARIRALVWAKAKEIGSGPALQALETWGKPMVEGLIQQIINKIKGAPPVVIPSPGT
jgi:hypothetical protein